MRKLILVLIIIIITIIAILLNSNNVLKIFYRQDYSEYVEKYAKESNLDSLLIYSIIKAESNFQVDASSNKGAVGLMQLMENTAKEVATNELIEYESKENLYDAETNIRIGIKYYEELKNTFKNDKIALAAYNAGMGRVNSWIEDGIINKDGSDIENIPYKETNIYVRKVLRDYEIYKKIYK